MLYVITAGSAPALGEVRRLGAGDALLLRPGWKSRPDYLRYLAAAAHAMNRGCAVHLGAERG